MEFVEFLNPVDPDKTGLGKLEHPLMLGRQIKIHTPEGGFPSLEGIDLAIIGIGEDRCAFKNQGCGLAPDYIRSNFYRLFQGPYSVKMADLGNLKLGHSPSDTYEAMKSIMAWLLDNKIIPIVLGGSQDLTYASYLAYESLGQIINIVSIDASFDLGLKDSAIDSHSYLRNILTHQPNFLFNYTNIGYQTYFVDQDAIDLMNKLYFDVYRLGLVRKDLEEVEPMVRNADLLTFDVSAIRQSDAPGNGNASPNGFYGEEACQILRYAGLSDKLSSVGFYEVNPAFDKGEQTSHLVAQMIWYFVDGYYLRFNDFPSKADKEKKAYIKYVVSLKDFKDEIVFYKSKKSDRWWMEVPCPSALEVKYERHFLVPCSYKDYQSACKEEIPERWWQVYQKFL